MKGLKIAKSSDVKREVKNLLEGVAGGAIQLVEVREVNGKRSMYMAGSRISKIKRWQSQKEGMEGERDVHR